MVRGPIGAARPQLARPAATKASNNRAILACIWPFLVGAFKSAYVLRVASSG